MPSSEDNGTTVAAGKSDTVTSPDSRGESCKLSDPEATYNLGGTSCVPVFMEGAAPPGLEDVGCASRRPEPGEPARDHKIGSKRISISVPWLSRISSPSCRMSLGICVHSLNSSCQHRAMSRSSAKVSSSQKSIWKMPGGL